MIGGNIDGIIQVKQVIKNELGEGVKSWSTVQTLHGWLDFLGGESKYATYNAKIEDSTHVFICDYVTLQDSINAGTSHMVVDGEIYDIKYIDNPMRLNQQLEIFLTFTGEKYGQHRN